MDNHSTTDQETWVVPPCFSVKLVSEGDVEGRPTVYGQRTAGRMFRKLLGEFDREVFAVMLLSPDAHIIGVSIVSVGSLTATIAHPREVLKVAILANAYAIVVAHNHPGGSAEPSDADAKATANLAQACDIMGIDLMDSLVIGQNYISSVVDQTMWRWDE